MLKRVVMFLLAAVLMIGTVPSQAFAAAAVSRISEEGSICADLGMLKGNTGVVDEAYLNSKPTRFQAAIMFLRLKGLEDEALSYAGDKNFDDARLVTWREGRNLLSYLKNHPELGWIGDGHNFKPDDLITGKEYYKVLLEALGYKQVLDGAGDFTWDNVLQYAAGKGLSKVANTNEFTVDSLAIATVEALKAKLKGRDTRLVESLIDKGVISERRAISAGLYREQLEADVDTVTAISNSRIEVVFKNPVYDIDMGNENDFSVNRGNSEIDIKDIYQKNDHSVILEVSPLTANTDYEVKVNGREYTVNALAKDSKSPDAIEVEGKDTELLEITFDRIMDARSAQNVETYSIKDVEIKAAKLDSTNTKVQLFTQGLQSGHSSELKIKNIKSADNVLNKSITKRFVARRDNTAPSIQTITVLNNIRLEVKFKDTNGLNKESAEDKDNYSITSSKGDIDVISAVASDKDNDGLYETVMLTTDTQTSGGQYTLHISGVSDDSVMKNKMSREVKRDFRGKSKDTSAPKIVGNPYVITDNKLQITFSDTNALDLDTVHDLNNYGLDNLDLISAEIKDPTDLYSTAGRTVILTTGDMEKSEQYHLTISGIADEFGNELNSTKKYSFRGKPADNTPPYILSVSMDEDTDDEIKLNFDDSLDKKTAEDTRNYRMDGLYLVTKAELDENEKTVTLTTSRLTSSSKHKLLLNGIEDLAGNAMHNVTVNVSVTSSYYNSDPAEVSDIEAMYNNEIQVHFEDRVKARGAKLVASGVAFKQVGEVIDEGTTIIMSSAPRTMENKEYFVSELSGVTNYNNKAYILEDDLSFYGTTEANEAPMVDDYEQTNVRTFRVVFNEPVLLKNGGVNGIHNPSNVSLGWSAYVNPDDEESDDAFRTIDYVASGNIPADREFSFNFTTMVTDYIGTPAEDEDDTDSNDSKATILESYLEDDDEPFVDTVEAVTSRKVQIVFSEEMSYAGKYKLTYENDKSKLCTIPIQSEQISLDDNTIVKLILGEDLSSEYYYTLECTSAAKDIAGNRVDIDDFEYDFDGVDIKDVDYLQGIDVNSAESFIITKSDTINSIESVYELDKDGNVIERNLISDTDRIENNECEVMVKKPLLKDVSYRVTADGLKYTFKGIVEDADITINTTTGKIEFDGDDTATQAVTVQRKDGTELDVYESNGSFYIQDDEQIAKGETLYVWVTDTNEDEIIYGARILMESGTVELSTQKSITEFAFKSLSPDVYAEIDEGSRTITLKVPYGTDVRYLAPNIAIPNHATISPVSGTVRDFSEPRTYIVTAQDGSTRTYTVKVEVAVQLSSQKNILGFAFKSLSPDVYGEIDEANAVILLRVPFGTEITSLVPTVTVSDKASVSPASGAAKNFTNPVIYTVIAENGSKKSYTVKVETDHGSSNKQITRFKLLGLNSTIVGAIDQQNRKVTFSIPDNEDITSLVTEIEVSENAAVTPRSGATLDFSEDRVFKVTAQDGSYQTYTAVVNEERSSNKKMMYFAFESLEPDAVGVINTDSNSIRVFVPYGTDVTKLAPTIKVSDKATISPKSKETVDFSTKQKYTVTAEDGTSMDYWVLVTVQTSSEKAIKEFGFKSLGVAGVINEYNKTITLNMPAGSNLTSLAADFICSANAKVTVDGVLQESGKTLNNFTLPVVYRVNASDGTFADYTVTAVLPGSSEKAITSFSCTSVDPIGKGIINERYKKIVVFVPRNAGVNHLVMSFTFTGSTVKVGDTVQKSGVTANDFSEPVVYTVTAMDGTKKTYSVSVQKKWN